MHVDVCALEDISPYLRFFNEKSSFKSFHSTLVL